MSNQSGIVAEQALLDTLSNESSTSLIIVTANIADDSSSVKLGQQYTSVTELESNLGDSPLYIFIRDSGKGEGYYNFISYVPDSAPIRLKMLYASTKNTIIRQIGTNSIGKQQLATDMDEIREAIEGSNGSNETALTESEIVEQKIAEQVRAMKVSASTSGGRQLVSQTGGTSHLLSFNVNTENISIKDLLNKNNVISFTIDIATEQVKIADQANITSPEQLEIISTHPSYTLYRNGSLVYFIYSCPSGSKVKDRMIYASNRLGFIKHLEANDKIQLAQVIEIGEPDELEISLISSSTEEEKTEKEEQIANNASAKKFSRPKGPSRKKRV